MNNLNGRLDKLRQLVQDRDFLEGKGLSNEVNIRIFCYDPQDEMTVTHFLNQIITDQSLDCNLIECNLYKLFIEICKDLDISSASCSVFRSSSRISFFFSSGKFAIAEILLLISFWSLAESFAQ